MFTPIGLLKENIDQFNDAVERGIIPNVDNPAEGSLDYVAENTRKDGSLTMNGVWRWLKSLQGLRQVFLKYQAVGFINNERFIALEKINLKLDQFRFSYYISEFARFGKDVVTPVSAYQTMMAEVGLIATYITSSTDEEMIKGMTDKTLALIDCVKNAFSEHLLEIMRAHSDPAIKGVDNDPSESIVGVHIASSAEPYSELMTRTNPVRKSKDSSSVHTDREKITIHDQEDGSSVLKLPADTFEVSECLKDMAQYMVDKAEKDTTPHEDICAPLQTAHGSLKMLDEYQFGVVGKVVRSSEGKLSDLQGGRAPINPKISDKD